MKNKYHHGNLKEELIEISIKVISEKGFESLSLRKISNMCGVSHNAVYRHFESKEELIECCRDYVTNALTNTLKEKVKDIEIFEFERIKVLCKAYVAFYKEHPTYFSFLYRNTSFKIIFTLDKNEEKYPPFEIFRETYCAIIEKNKLEKEEALKKLVYLWSLINGMIFLIVSTNVECDEKYINDILEKGGL